VIIILGQGHLIRENHSKSLLHPQFEEIRTENMMDFPLAYSMMN